MSRRKKYETNTDFVVRLMEFSRYGALSQLFILTAIEKYAAIVEDAEPVEHGLIGGNTWKAIAQEMKTELDKKYRRG